MQNNEARESGTKKSVEAERDEYELNKATMSHFTYSCSTETLKSK